MNNLEQAALMLSVAKDSILQATGAAQIEIDVRDGNLEVFMADAEKFDRLAEGQEVEVTKLEGCLKYPYRHSFWLHGIRFYTLKEEG